MSRTVLFGRRTDIQGLERLELDAGPDCVTATSTVICLESGGFRLEHRWLLSPDWRAQSVQVERRNAKGHGSLLLERSGAGWHEADLVVDEAGLVQSYEQLFERL